MISRTKANYSLRDLVRAAFVRAGSVHYKEALVEALQAYTRCPNVLLVPSGRAGLFFILRSIPRSRVILPSYTCKAVAEAVILAGKQPVYVDVERDGFNVDPAALASVLDDQSILVATHQFGIPCAIEPMVALAAERGTIVVEDAAASLGTRVGGRLTGTFGDAAFFSFDSTKLINVPMKGGFIVAKDPGVFGQIARDYEQTISAPPSMRKWWLLLQAAALVFIERPALYRAFHWLVFASRKMFTQDSAALNLILDEFYRYDMREWQAFIAVKQVKDIDALIAKRREIYRNYQRSLAGTKSIRLPPADTHAEWACTRFPVRVRGDKIAYYWEAAERGVDFAFSFTYLACPRSFEKAWDIADTVLDLPHYTKLTQDEQQHVVHVLNELDRTNRL